MASTVTAEFTRVEVEGLSFPSPATITKVQHLTSYNWVEAANSTIIVPGTPALWSPPAGSRRLRKDSGFIYIAQNAARHPDSPLEPLFRALYTANPCFDIRSVDIVTDRNNMRKLHSFITSEPTKKDLEDFTIAVEVVGNTAIFARMETATSEFIGPKMFRGYGHEFEKAYTTSQIKGSTGHHRVISYCFGGLNFIVRHEADGYLNNEKATTSSETSDISNLMASLSLSDLAAITTSIPTGSKLTVKEAGDAVSIDSTIEIKTRTMNKKLEIKDVAPQLWVSQTPRLVRAYHRNGTFTNPKVEDVRDEIKKWETESQEDLKKLAALINKILAAAKDCGGRAMIKYDAKIDKLSVYGAGGNKMLPEDLYSKWDAKEIQEVAAEQKSSSKSADQALAFGS